MCATYQTPLLEVVLISAPEPEEPDASIEQSLENQAPTTSLSLGGGDPEENTLGEEFNGGNEIITPTDDLLAHDPVAAQPTLDNSVKDVQVEHPEVIGEEPGEAKELVEDAASSPGIIENILRIHLLKIYQINSLDALFDGSLLRKFQSCLLDYKLVWRCVAADFLQLKSWGE